MTQEQKLQIANLRQNQGFLLLLQFIKLKIDSLQETLIEELDLKKSLEVLNLWKSLNKVYYILKNRPEEFGQDLEELEEFLPFQPLPTPNIEGVKEMMHRLQQVQQNDVQLEQTNLLY